MGIMKIGIIGIHGFAQVHVNIILDLIREKKILCAAFADPTASIEEDICKKLIEVGAKPYKDYRQMLENHPEMDCVSILTPMYLHRDMCITAMEKGFHVFVEKPPAVLVKDLDQMLETSEVTGKLCAVNFQNTSGEAFRLLIEKLQQKIIGEVETIAAVGIWKRTEAYYQRASWAGKVRMGAETILDGTIHNALSHLLQNCMMIAGNGDTKAAAPHTVQAELYKGHRIESEDTSCMRICTKNGKQILFYGTLCGNTQQQPFISIEGSEGRMLWDYGNCVQIQKRNGEEEKYQFGKEDLIRKMYLNFMDVWEGKQKELYCSLEDCRSFLLAANGAFQSAGQVAEIPSRFLEEVEGEGGIYTEILEIDPCIQKACQEKKLLSEMSIEWAYNTEVYTIIHGERASQS